MQLVIWQECGNAIFRPLNITLKTPKCVSTVTDHTIFQTNLHNLFSIPLKRCYFWSSYNFS